MNTINRISATAVLAVSLLALSPSAWPLGLGDATVESFLNQPLQARIDLISQETDDLASVTAKLASADDYELIGASREAVPVPVRFTIENIEGDAYILATSNLPMGNPVVRLIVEVNWASGRLLREYTLFLDPPSYTEPAPLPRVDFREPAEPIAAAPSPEPAASPTPAAPEASDQQPAAAQSGTSARVPDADEYGPVKRGDTLWGIASDWSRGSGMDLNKVMIAIQRENPNAFMRNNINLLKRGAILRMPEADDVNTISTAAAINEVSTQEDEFRGRRSAEAVASPTTPLLAEESAIPEPEVSPVAEAEEAVPEISAEQQQAETADSDSVAAEAPSQLELVPPSQESDLDSAYGFEESDESDVEAEASVSTLREDLARREEELINQQQQNAYLEERIKELESQLVTAEEGNVEDASLAAMEERLREERLAEAAASEKAAPRPKPRDASRQAAKTPWYNSFTVWLIVFLVLAAAVAGWFLSRRGGDEFVSDLDSDEEQLREIKVEAEEVLRVLEDSGKGEDGETEEVAEAGDVGEPDEAAEVADGEDETGSMEGRFDGDAELLDEESSDPEIQLDLARAYISMGDKEAARVILEEVLHNGSEEQQAEARSMMDQL